MKALSSHPSIIKMATKKEILRRLSWLEKLEEDELSEIASSFDGTVFQCGDTLVNQNELSDCVHLVRGTVALSYINEYREVIEIDELGMSSVFGEIAWALQWKRGAR